MLRASEGFDLQAPCARYACRTMVLMRKMTISTHSMAMHNQARPDFWVFSALTSSFTPSSTCSQKAVDKTSMSLLR